MWLFTTDGFYSAVEHRDDPDFILIRARWREDLECLKEFLRPRRMEELFNEPLHRESDSLWETKPLNQDIQDTPDADYPYRMNVTQNEWRFFLKTKALEIDYDNFKETIHRRGGSDDRLERYFGVWAAMRGNL